MSGLTELRSEIEQVALQMVMGSARPADWIPLLQRVRRQAAAEKATAAETAAVSMIASLEGLAASNGPATESSAELQEQLARLQQALESGPPAPAGSNAALAQDPELLSDFVLESREHLASIESRTLTLEREPGDTEALHAVFRGFHTIKGLAGFLELWEVQTLAHEVETILDRARNLELAITPAAIDVILKSADHLRAWVSHLEARLHAKASDPPRTDPRFLEVIRALAATGERPEAMSQDLRAMAGAVEAPPPVEPQATPAPTGRTEAMAVKVSTAKLDYLVDMAGEMVIAQSLVRHDPDLAAIKSSRLQRNLAQLTRITTELQKTSMAMRLVPIGPLFRRMTRLVRDLSRQFGKPVEIETIGDEIELDRNIVEELADPLMHLVRNAVDHGVEPPEERERAGKNRTARVLLRAHHQAGQVVIEISDDGRGLDRERIAAKAIERGMITSSAGLSDAETFELIFQPGFTTAAAVTNVSGRGVGMDVVRRHIETLRGRIETRSAPGEGATFLLKLPLTLAIIDGLVVAVGRERYIVPLFGVREVFRPSEGVIWTVQERSEMALVRDTLLPVVRLYRKFNVTPRSENACESVLLVAEVEGQRFSILVDELIGKQEVVIKSLGETFKGVTGIAGGAILGDGRVGLILDLERLFKERHADNVH